MAFLHLKDCGGEFNEWNFPALGDGNIDFKKIFSILGDYTGPISVEIEFDGKKRAIEEIDKAVKKSYRFIKNLGRIK